MANGYAKRKIYVCIPSVAHGGVFAERGAQGGDLFGDALHVRVARLRQRRVVHALERLRRVQGEYLTILQSIVYLMSSL